MKPLSKTEKLLRAAGALAMEGRSEFTAEDLIVWAHRLFPDDFSLKGYREHPDSNLILTQVMGIKAPLIVRGWLEKTGTKKYRLTSKGLHDLSLVVEASTEASDSVGGAVSIERKQDEAIGRLLTSTAFELFRQDRANEITFHQFCRFIGLSARDRWQRIAGRMASVKHLIEEARRLRESGHSLRVHLEHNYTFTSDDLRLLPALHDYLVDKFRSEMDQWRRHAT